jgi:hypothetical protein
MKERVKKLSQEGHPSGKTFVDGGPIGPIIFTTPSFEKPRSKARANEAATVLEQRPQTPGPEPKPAPRQEEMPTPREFVQGYLDGGKEGLREMPRNKPEENGE